MALIDVIDALETGQPLPEPDRLELAKALREYRRGRGFAFLGVERIRRRNALLRQAADLLDDGTVTPWELAGRLARAITRFNARVLPRHQGRELHGVDALLLQAHRTGARGLTSQRRLYDLLTG